MPLADRDRPGAVRSRFPLVSLLCAVALGIIGMHGLGSADPGVPVGHHAAPTFTTTADTTGSGDASLGAVAGDETPPADDPADDVGLLALCLMVLTPGLALGSWLVSTSALGGTWRLPRPVARIVAAVDTAGLPPPRARQLTVLRI